MVQLASTQLDTHGRLSWRQLRCTQTHVRTHTADDMGCVTSIFCICIVALAAVSVPTSLKLGTAGVGRQTAGPAEDEAAATRGERRAQGGGGDEDT